jgi:hypothetical protein
MWTVVQFALLREGDYGAGFELLADCGFRRQRAPRPNDLRPYPAAVIADLSHDTAAITRAVFDRLAGAGLGPVAVMAATADVARAANSPQALAQA